MVIWLQNNSRTELLYNLIYMDLDAPSYFYFLGGRLHHFHRSKHVQICSCSKSLQIELVMVVKQWYIIYFWNWYWQSKGFHLTQGFILKLYIVFYVQKRLKIDFQDSVVMDQKLKTVLERLLEPAPEDRFQVHFFSLLIEDVFLYIYIHFYFFVYHMMAMHV
mgnify:CR=1 FL=1